MAFDKQHIDGLKKEILLVKELGDKIGYLVMLNMASAIFKFKDKESYHKHKVLKRHLTEIINEVENYDEDYYKLVHETLNTTTEKKEIEWTEQNKYFGLDYSTKIGTFLDYTFDIRYDYEGAITVKPEKCGCCLIIYFKGAKIYSTLGSMDALTKISERYLKTDLEKYRNVTI